MDRSGLADGAVAIEYATAAVRPRAIDDVRGAGNASVVLRGTAFPDISAVVWRTPVIAGPCRAAGAAVKLSTATVGHLATGSRGTFVRHASTGAINDSTATIWNLAAKIIGTGPCRATRAAINGSTATVTNLATRIRGTTLWRACAGAVDGSTATVANLAARTSGTSLRLACAGAVDDSTATVALWTAQAGDTRNWFASNFTLGTECNAGFAGVSTLGLITVVSNDLQAVGVAG